MFRSSSSSDRNHQRQLSSSLSFKRMAASPFLDDVAVGSGAMTILRSPAKIVSSVAFHRAKQHPNVPSNGGRSRSVTLNRRCSPCSRRKTVSIEASHHPRATPDSREFQVASKSCSMMLLTVLAREGPAGSDMKGESRAMRSAAADCVVRKY